MLDADGPTGLSRQGRRLAGTRLQAGLLVHTQDHIKPAIEWAFVKAQVTPGLSLRAGRIGAPLFAVSDFRSIGYSNLWLRTPIDVYGQVPFSHFDGADAIYQDTVGGTTLTAQVFGGRSNAVASGNPVHIKKEVGINVTAEFDNGLTLRVGHVQGKLTVDNASVAGLLAILRATPFASIADQMDATDKDASFTGVGIAYDQGNWVANAEYTKRRTSSYVSDTTGWEATLGYRVGKFTPYATVSQLKRDSSNVNNTIPTAVPQLAPLAAGVNAVLFNQDLAQKTDAIGVRWDAWKNIDVKAQYDRVKPAAGAPGLFYRVTGPMPSAVNVYSVAVDFVF